MKKLVLMLVVLALVVPAKAVIFSDNFNVGGPPDPENRSPVNWDTWATIPGNAFMKLSNRGDENLLAMVLSQWGTDCGITTKSSYSVAGLSSVDISVETMREGWGWHLTGLVGGIFKDGGGNSLGTVLVPLTDIGNGVYFDSDTAWVWYVHGASVGVPSGAATVQFQIVNRNLPGNTNGAIWFDNFVATPEPVTVCLLGLGALLIRRK